MIENIPAIFGAVHHRMKTMQPSSPSMMIKIRLLVLLFVIATPVELIDAQKNSGYEPPEYNDGEYHYENKEQQFDGFTVIRYIEDCRAFRCSIKVAG